MFLAIIVIIVFVFLAYFVWGCRDIVDAVIDGLLGVLCCFAILPIAWGLTCVFDADHMIANSETTNIVSMKDNYSAYIRHHYSKSGMKYTYLYNDEGRGIANKSVPANKSYINYTTGDETPHVIESEMIYKNPILNGLLWPIGTYTEYYFYVPEGSIITEGQYKIDLE